MTEKNIALIGVDALQENFRYLRDKITAASPQTAAMCVVKADAYGHSVNICVPALYAAGARHFAVSSIEEAEQIYGILDAENHAAKTILILGYTPAEYDNVKALVREGITQTVFSLDYARALSEAVVYLQKQKVLAKDALLRCHVKLDSGMNRLGFDTHAEAVGDTVAQISAAAKLPGLSLDGVFSHFACADEADTAMTEEQFARYMRVVDACAAVGVHFEEKHICNSAGALRFPSMYQSMVRLGIVLYGLSPSDEVKDACLRPVMRLCSRVGHIHTVHAGDCISYGAEFCAKKEMRVATIPIGYADGFIRAYQNGTVVYRGRALPILGRICMDQCVVDVSDVDIAVGDYVDIFDESGENIERLCKAAGTINYEALCLVSKRVRRVPASDVNL